MCITTEQISNTTYLRIATGRRQTSLGDLQSMAELSWELPKQIKLVVVERGLDPETAKFTSLVP